MYYPADRNLALALSLQGADAGDGQVRRLVGVARLLEAVPDPDIDPGFAARLEARLMREDVGLVLAVTPTPRRDEPIHRTKTEHRAAIIRLPRRRLVVRKAIAATIAALLALALPVVATASSLPGSPGYTLKLRVEKWRISLTHDPIERGFRYFEFADRRLAEAAELAPAGLEAYFPQTVRLVAWGQRLGATLILKQSNDRDVLARVAGLLQSQGVALVELLSEVPPAAREDVLDAIRTGRALSLRVAAALGLPMIRPPATVAPGAGGPEQASLDSEFSSDPAWDALESGSSPADPSQPRVGGGPERRNSDATYMRCKLDPYRGPSHEDIQTAACPQSLTAPEVYEIVHIADYVIPKGPEKSGPAPSASCPSPKTCRLYQLKPYRWPTSKGIATMRFSVNPQQRWMTENRAKDAVLAATRTWSAANSKVRFSFAGLTDRIPTLGDSRNDVGWVPLDPGLVAIASIRRVGSRILEADIKFNAILPWNWTPCAQRGNTCTSVQGDEVVGRFDVQSIATHELGHAIGLGHLEHTAGQPESADLSRELSMYAQPHPGERKQATLGLGDVLAIRAAYPCKGCRVPPVYAP